VGLWTTLKGIVDRTPNHWSTFNALIYLQYLGHIARRSGTMERLIIEENVEGKRSRGRSPTRKVDQTKPLINMRLHDAERIAQDRQAWNQLLNQI